MKTGSLELVVLALWGGLTGACDPFHTGFADVEDAVYYQARSLSPQGTQRPSTVFAMTWNIRFASGRIPFFWECGGGRALMRGSEVLERLSAIAAKIRQVDPDIILLEEVDVGAKRSDYVDQVQWLLDHTDLNYAVYASQWKADFVPSDGVGPMDSGTAIASRWPLGEAERIALPLIGDQDPLTNYFYLHRNILRTRVHVHGATDGSSSSTFMALAVHTEAFSDDGTKRKHIDRFKAEIDALAAQGELVLAGGDLNALPPGTAKVRGFPDSDCSDARFEGDDYTGEQDWLAALYATYQAAIPLVDYQNEQGDGGRFFTFSDGEHILWNRKLDYLFTNGVFVSGSGIIHQNEARGGMETLSLSDHAPLSVELVP